MAIPKLKKITISSEQDLRTWLRKNADMTQDVMIVTRNKTSPTKHVSTAQVRDTATEEGWSVGRGFTLEGNLLGQVISPTSSTR